MRTKITELLGIKYPIICGGMLWLCTPKLCAAISEAGGLGNITAANYNSADEFRTAIKEVKALTNKPFGVTITIMPAVRISPELIDQYFQVCCEEKVAAIEVSGSPATKYLPMLKEAGVKVMHKVGAVRHAKKIEQLGYDAVIAAGIEEGGHPLNDDVTCMVLTPRMAESVRIPVIQTGGIADGRGLAAALALGAEGVHAATRFIFTPECEVHPNIHKEMVKYQENDTTLVLKSMTQGRALKNKCAERVLEIEARGGGIDELMPLISGQTGKNAWETGDVDGALFYVGQSIGLINDVKTCKEVIDDMVKGAEILLRKKTEIFD